MNVNSQRFIRTWLNATAGTSGRQGKWERGGGRGRRTRGKINYKLYYDYYYNNTQKNYEEI